MYNSIHNYISFIVTSLIRFQKWFLEKISSIKIIAVSWKMSNFKMVMLSWERVSSTNLCKVCQIILD